MGNAVKFTFKGSISVNIEFDEETKQLITSVKDTGHGILEEDKSKLFKFFGCLAKTKDINKSGLGLGLTISKMIVQQFGGDINLDSTYEVGSTFTFNFPLE